MFYERNSFNGKKEWKEDPYYLQKMWKEKLPYEEEEMCKLWLWKAGFIEKMGLEERRKVIKNEIRDFRG